MICTCTPAWKSSLSWCSDGPVHAPYCAAIGGIDEQLVAYAKLIVERWRALSDGERMMLMALCCPRCGACVTRRNGPLECCEMPR